MIPLICLEKHLAQSKSTITVDIVISVFQICIRAKVAGHGSGEAHQGTCLSAGWQLGAPWDQSLVDKA